MERESECWREAGARRDTVGTEWRGQGLRLAWVADVEIGNSQLCDQTSGRDQLERLAATIHSLTSCIADGAL